LLTFWRNTQNCKDYRPKAHIRCVKLTQVCLHQTEYLLMRLENCSDTRNFPPLSATYTIHCRKKILTNFCARRGARGPGGAKRPGDVCPAPTEVERRPSVLRGPERKLRTHALNGTVEQTKCSRISLQSPPKITEKPLFTRRLPERLTLHPSLALKTKKDDTFWYHPFCFRARDGTRSTPPLANMHK